MDKTIDIFINGSFVTKNSNFAGVQGEGNAAVLHMTFDESWSEFAKTVTFWDSRGENPVQLILTTDLLVDMSSSLLEYNVRIPYEPMAHEGEMTFVIDGVLDDERMRTYPQTLSVSPAQSVENAGEPTDPTPSLAEQLQREIENILPAVQQETADVLAALDSALAAAEQVGAAVEAAQTAAGTATEAADEATTEAGHAAADAVSAKSYAVGGTGSREGEDTDNAKYYAEQARAAAGGEFATTAELQALADVVSGVQSTVTQQGQSIAANAAAVTQQGQSIAANAAGIAANAAAVAGKQAQHKTVTLTLYAEAWNEGTPNNQAVVADGVEFSNDDSFVVSPAPASFAEYTAAGMYCAAVVAAMSAFSFACATIPTADITVNVLILPAEVTA